LPDDRAQKKVILGLSVRQRTGKKGRFEEAKLLYTGITNQHGEKPTKKADRPFEKEINYSKVVR